MYDSLYLNFMGEHFSLLKAEKKRQDFKLDINGYTKVKNDIIRHRIEQEIRYSELTTNTTSLLAP